MTQYKIRGGIPLQGSIHISGAKNAAVAILPAALMVDGICQIDNIPKVSDIRLMLELMKELGAKVNLVKSDTVVIDSRNINPNAVPSYERVRKMRASYYLLGAYLSRFGRANVALPGGCDFGTRPIDQHVKGFEMLGTGVAVRNGTITAAARSGRLQGATVYLDFASVGATINVMLAATLAEGKTVIENAAREPHIVDLANFLNQMGADIRGAGTDVIKIHGKESLHGGSYTVIPDQIEAGTYMTAVASAGGCVRLENVIPKHLECITQKFLEMGIGVEEDDDSVTVTRHNPMRPVSVKTLPYPGFPTDMQPQITACLASANGLSTVTEGVWDNRFRYVDELRRLGANIRVEGRLAIIEGVSSLSGAPVQACDLRAGAALVVAALGATGITTVDGILHIERGYEDICGKLASVGANIHRMEIPDSDIVAEMIG